MISISGTSDPIRLWACTLRLRPRLAGLPKSIDSSIQEADKLISSLNSADSSSN